MHVKLIHIRGDSEGVCFYSLTFTMSLLYNLILMPSTEGGHWEYSAATRQSIANLEKLEHSIAVGTGRGMGVDLYIAGATWILTGRGDIALTALGIAGIAAAVVFAPTEATIPFLKWIARLRDKDAVWTDPNSSQNPKI